ncbi:hypothetical protein [Virgibacillus sp. CBA3643]|uniref:hypothetical protein n=1 Tax=Virgibacillus sp. CBA3643 TaxID=2942278 RepID=UPI0035A38498
MNKKVFNIIGWILLLGIIAWWFGIGYTDWNLLLLPAAYICFSISNGSIKNLKRVKMLSVSQVTIIVFTFIISIAVVFGLIQLAGYLIDNIFDLHGWIKTLFEYLAIILSLFPGVFLLASVMNKIDDRLNVNYIDSPEKTSAHDDLKTEASDMLKTMTEVQTIKSLRQRYSLSLIDAKNIVDSTKP